jgi:hypothetical protein
MKPHHGLRIIIYPKRQIIDSIQKRAMCCGFILQDFAENGADYAHFAYVHDLLTIPWAEYIIDVKHTLEIQFGDATKGEGHMAWFTDKADLVWKKSQKEIPHAGGQATVTYYGPGFLVFQFNTKIGKMLLIKTFTPLGELKVRMEDYIYAPKGTYGLAIKYSA